MFYYGTMYVGNDVVSVGSNVVGVGDVVADVGNGCICIDCEFSLGTRWLAMVMAMAVKRQQNAR